MRFIFVLWLSAMAADHLPPDSQACDILWEGPPADVNTEALECLETGLQSVQVDRVEAINGLASALDAASVCHDQLAMSSLGQSWSAAVSRAKILAENPRVFPEVRILALRLLARCAEATGHDRDDILLSLAKDPQPAMRREVVVLSDSVEIAEMVLPKETDPLVAGRAALLLCRDKPQGRGLAPSQLLRWIRRDDIGVASRAALALCLAKDDDIRSKLRSSLDTGDGMNESVKAFLDNYE